MLIKFVSTHKLHWSAYLDTCIFAYNTSRQDSTLFTPFELMFGRRATLPIDINIQRESTKELIDDVDLADVNKLNEKRKNLLHKAKVNILNAQKKQKDYYDRKRANPLCYKAGALVLVKDFTRKKRKGGKLDAKWVGPYVIQKKCTRGVYSVALPNDTSETKRVTGAHLKLYKQLCKSQDKQGNQPL